MIEFLELHGTPRQRGEQHGEALRDQVQALFEIRRELLYKRSPVKDSGRISRLADAQWAVTEKLFPALCEEMDGIARAAKVTREAMVILNNYTDFRDIGPGVEGCTAVYVQHPEGVYLGQTWDMHASAEPFVIGMRVADCIVLTVAGCVGMMGMNPHGVGVTVNNLVSNDAQIGVIWPCLVRAMLEQSSVAAMSDVLERTTLCSGHNYLLGDRHGCANWETSGQRKKVTHRQSGPGIFFHTNHYLDPEMRACEGKIPAQSTTHDRFRLMENVPLPDHLGATDVVRWLSSHEGAPRSVCSHMGTDDPDASKTCGGVVCALHDGVVTAWRGCLADAGNGVAAQTLSLAAH